MTQDEFDKMMHAINVECKERTASLRKELYAITEEYRERKEALRKAFPNVKGMRKQKSQGMTKHKAFSLRAKMIEQLKERFKDVPYVDLDGINVHFSLDNESVTFKALIPKKN